MVSWVRTKESSFGFFYTEYRLTFTFWAMLPLNVFLNPLLRPLLPLKLGFHNKNLVAEKRHSAVPGLFMGSLEFQVYTDHKATWLPIKQEVDNC